MKNDEPEPAKRARGRPRADQAGGREDIKAAALQEFAKTGFKATSIDQIAEAAGVAKPLIHYHFASKAALWEDAVSDAFSAYQNEFMTFAVAVAKQPADVAITAFADALVRFNAKHVALNQIIGDEVRQPGERGAWLLKTYITPMNHMMLGVLKTLLPDGADVNTRAAHLMPTFAGAVNTPFLDAPIMRDSFDVDVFSEHYLEEQARFIAMLLRAALEDAKNC